MLHWVNFLHLYQPPAQDEYIFHQVARESYFEIAKFFDRYDHIRLTMNLSGSLLEQLIAYRYDQLLEDFRTAFAQGEMELTGSAMYHPILPLLPPAEMERQIILDEGLKRAVFGENYRRVGFYLPEMAYSRPVAELLERMGFAWIILDEISAAGRLGAIDTGRAYRVRGLKLKVLFRARHISSSFVPEALQLYASSLPGDGNIVTATDGELYGHRHRDFYAQTREIFEDGRIRSEKASDFLARCGEDLPEIEPVTSCWESNPEELSSALPFAFWRDPRNEIQEGLWDFAAFVRGLLAERQEDPNFSLSRCFADRALSSCHFWAASGKVSAIWKDTIWNPDAIERGNGFLLKAVRSLVSLEPRLRLEGEEKSRRISALIWQRHWGEFYAPPVVEYNK